MEDEFIKIDDDLKDYLSSKDNPSAFVNKCIREEKSKEHMQSVRKNIDKMRLKSEEDDSVHHYQDNPRNRNGGNKLAIFTGIGMAIVLTMTISSFRHCSNKEKAHTYLKEYDTLGVKEETPVKKNVIKKTWDFTTETDAMTSSTNKWATLVSDNMINQDSPYDISSASITVRYMKKYGYDVLIGITSGQIYGNEYNNENYIVARFDNGTPVKYWFNEPSDGSSESVFVRKKSDFIRRCKKAKLIKVEIPIFRGGRPVFEFSVDEPLRWK